MTTERPACHDCNDRGYTIAEDDRWHIITPCPRGCPGWPNDQLAALSRLQRPTIPES